MIRKGTEVKWQWGKTQATGKVTEVCHGEVTITSKGNKVTRKGSDDNPAYKITQEDGTKVLKLQSEVQRV
jgi:hypothetical protein